MGQKIIKINFFCIGLFFSAICSAHTSEESDRVNQESFSKSPVKYKDFLNQEEIKINSILSLYVIPYEKLTRSDQTEVTCLAKNIYFESRNQEKIGQIAVGLVTLNRLEAEEYPSTVCQVVYSKTRKVCAFSWVCEHKNIKRSDMIELSAWKEILDLASALYQRKNAIMADDFTKGAIYFYSGRRPSWVGRKVLITARIGEHTFWKYA